MGGPRAVDLGVVGRDKVSPGFKTEYGEAILRMIAVLFKRHGSVGIAFDQRTYDI